MYKQDDVPFSSRGIWLPSVSPIHYCTAGLSRGVLTDRSLFPFRFSMYAAGPQPVPNKVRARFYSLLHEKMKRDKKFVSAVKPLTRRWWLQFGIWTLFSWFAVLYQMRPPTSVWKHHCMHCPNNSGQRRGERRRGVSPLLFLFFFMGVLSCTYLSGDFCVPPFEPLCLSRAWRNWD